MFNNDAFVEGGRLQFWGDGLKYFIDAFFRKYYVYRYNADLFQDGIHLAKCVTAEPNSTYLVLVRISKIYCRTWFLKTFLCFFRDTMNRFCSEKKIHSKNKINDNAQTALVIFPRDRSTCRMRITSYRDRVCGIPSYLFQRFRVKIRSFPPNPAYRVHAFIR